MMIDADDDDDNDDDNDDQERPGTASGQARPAKNHTRFRSSTGRRCSSVVGLCKILDAEFEGTDAQVLDAEVRSLMMMIAIPAYTPHR